MIEKETITGDEFMEIFNKVKDERNAYSKLSDEADEVTDTAE